MLYRLEAYLKTIIDDKRQGLIAKLLRGILFCISLGFQYISYLRRRLYDKGFLSQTKVLIPIVSVGNIVAGGTGKTPMVLWLAKELEQRHKVGILIRGYRSKAERKKHPTLVTSKSKAQEVGDEALLLAKSCKDAIVVVCKNRVLGALFAKNRGADVLIMDDGLQHRKLQRDREIIVVDCQKPLGNGYFLPRGYLRESPKALRRADLVVMTNCYSKDEIEEAKKRLYRYVRVPIVYTVPKIIGFYDFSQQELQISLQGQKVALFCAIAHPENFRRSIELLGACVVEELFDRDHCVISLDQIKEFIARSMEKGAKIFLCTEKDRVKMPKELKLLEGNNQEASLLWVKMELQVIENRECLQRILC